MGALLCVPMNGFSLIMTFFQGLVAPKGWFCKFGRLMSLLLDLL